MGTGKKEKTRKERQGKQGDSMGNVKVKGENFYRSAKKVKTLNMFKDGKAQRNAQGEITKAASYQSREAPTGRVEPNRRWFNSTRVIAQDSLTSFREAMKERAADPYQVLLKSNKLPMSLLDVKDDGPNGIKQHKAKMQIESSPWAETFGPKAQRKRVKLDVGNLEDLAGETMKMHDVYLDRLEEAKLLSGAGDAVEQAGEAEPEAPILTTAKEPIFSKGQSKRIWNELYKVIDSSGQSSYAYHPSWTLHSDVLKTSSFTYWIVGILLGRGVDPSRSILGKRHHTSIWSSYSTSVI